MKGETNVRHQHDSASNKADNITENEVESPDGFEAVLIVTEQKDSSGEALTNGTDEELSSTLGHSQSGNSEKDGNLTLVISDENTCTGEPVLDSSKDDGEKARIKTEKKQQRIIHPSGKLIQKKVTEKMAQNALMKILHRKGEKGTVSDDKESQKVELTRVLEFVHARKPKEYKI